MSQALTQGDLLLFVRARLTAIDKLMPVYKKVATTDHVAVAEKLRADLDKENYPSLQEAAIDAATLEKAFDYALVNNAFGP